MKRQYLITVPVLCLLGLAAALFATRAPMSVRRSSDDALRRGGIFLGSSRNLAPIASKDLRRESHFEPVAAERSAEIAWCQWQMPWPGRQPVEEIQPIPDPSLSYVSPSGHDSNTRIDSTYASGQELWCSEPGGPALFNEFDLGGPARTPAAGHYRIRSGDVLQFTYQQTRQRMSAAYRLSYGDQVRITSDTHPELNLVEPTEVLPDGTISIPGVQSVQVNNLTFEEAKQVIENKLRVEGKYNAPRITILPVLVYQRLQDLLDAVDARFGNGGQGIQLTVIRDGTVALPSIGTVSAIGLTKEELMYEINSRYDQVVEGIHVTVNIVETAPSFVYVLGQVEQPGRLEARLPMTVLQAIAQAGGHLQGGNLRYVVVVRRTPDWRLVAHRIDLSFANRARPKTINDMWLWDSDVVIVPKDNIQRLDELIDMYLTRGAYSLLPTQLTLDQNSVF